MGKDQPVTEGGIRVRRAENSGLQSVSCNIRRYVEDVFIFEVVYLR
jgi:hypothetical protein